jgi:hypothetical protein
MIMDDKKVRACAVRCCSLLFAADHCCSLLITAVRCCFRATRCRRSRGTRTTPPR